MGPITEKLEAVFAFIILAIMAGTVRTIMTEEQRNFSSYIRAIIIAGFVGYLVSQALDDYDIGDGIKGCIVGVSAFIASDVLNGILKISGELADDPLATIKKIKGLWYGKGKD